MRNWKEHFTENDRNTFIKEKENSYEKTYRINDLGRLRAK